MRFDRNISNNQHKYLDMSLYTKEKVIYNSDSSPMIKKTLIFSTFLVLFAFGYRELHKEKQPILYPEALIPKEWMKEQVERDLLSLRSEKISLRKMKEYFFEKHASHPIAQIQIRKNKVRKFVPPEIAKSWIGYRFNVVYSAVKELAKSYPLPDTTLYLFLWDSWEESSYFPILVFAKKAKFSKQILIPDFSSLAKGYQILPTVDLEQEELPWEERQAKLSWRGSTSQGIDLTRENYKSISRVTLCEISRQNPELIDAGFTLYYQGADTVPELEIYRKGHLPYEELVKNKYQILIDGNSASYSDSGWRFFVNSVVIKPDSENIQWYYHTLKPNIHYLPVRENLEDLTEKVEFLKNNDQIAKQIAKNGREFAVSNLTRSQSLRYLYHVIWEYSRLKFIN
jgi:hypothetical protein